MPTDTTPPTDITNLLPDEALARLRAAFNTASYPGQTLETPDGRFGMYAQGVLVSRFLPARRYVEVIGDYYYDDHKELGPTNRERVVLASLLAHANDGGYFFSLHVYWSLMIGLSPREIGWVIALCSAYSGIDRYTLGTTITWEVLSVLKAQAEKGDAAALAPTVIVPILAQTFASRH